MAFNQCAVINSLWKPNNLCIVCKQFKQNKFQFHFVIIRIKFLFSLYIGSHSFISLLSHDLQFCTLLDLGFQGRRGTMKNFTKWNTHYTFRIIIENEFNSGNKIVNLQFVLGNFQNSSNNINNCRVGIETELVTAYCKSWSLTWNQTWS